MLRPKPYVLSLRRIQSRLTQGVIVFGLAALMSACAPAPVQEMSEARQAIDSARAAGAEQHAKEQLDEAHSLLDTAQQMLNDRLFRDARRSASQARDAAIRARETAEAVAEQ